jgi:ABC-2 type transport system ATP-binding protein
MEVPEGVIFGLVGPNGAGKTTFMKMMLDFVRPTEGTLSIFGQDPSEPELRSNIGYLPENPQFYQHLSVEETIKFVGRLHGMSSAQIQKRTDALLERVGLAYARERRVSNLSKGMTQRMGIAQALVNDPDFLIFDEPQSGLDPIGRRDVRQLLVSLNESGRTILFSSHILHDVEMVSDAVCILDRGDVVYNGPIERVLERGGQLREIRLEDVTEDTFQGLDVVERIYWERGSLCVVVDGLDSANQVCSRAIESGGSIVSVTATQRSLENIFEELNRTTSGVSE